MNGTTPAGLGFGRAQSDAKASILNRIRAEEKGSGPSSSAVQVDGWVSSFVSQATQTSSLAALTGSALAYRLARIAVIGAEAGSLLRTSASVGLGLTAEVSTFEFVNRSLAGAGKNSALWRWNGNGGLSRGLLQSLVTFGALKGVGRLAQGENLIAQHLLQDTTMVLSHQMTGALGLSTRPTGTLAEQFLHAEATNLHLGAGLALSHSLAPGLNAWDRGLQISIPIPTAKNFDFPFLNLAFEGFFSREKTGKASPRKKLDFSWVMMVEKKDPSPTLRPSLSPPSASKSNEPDTESLDAGWEDRTPVRSYRIPPSDLPPDSSAPSRPSQLHVETADILRRFLFEPKEDRSEILESIRDYLTFCRTDPEGKKELPVAIMELRERAKLILTHAQKSQFLFTYNQLVRELPIREPVYWKELEALGNTLKSPRVEGDMKNAFSVIFIRLAEKLWQERPAVAIEMRETFEIIREIHGNEALPAAFRGRAMNLYAEFHSFIPK